MTNHFHLLVWVPDRARMRKLPKETLLELLPILYDASQRLGIEQEISRTEASGDLAWMAQNLECYEIRCHDLTSFVKDLNPIRSGMVKNPEDYHCYGYAEAVAGKRENRGTGQ